MIENPIGLDSFEGLNRRGAERTAPNTCQKGPDPVWNVLFFIVELLVLFKLHF